MAISFACDCGKSTRVKDDLAGKTVRCPACQAVVRVPRAEPEAFAVKEDDQPRPEPPKRRRKKKTKPAFAFPWKLVVGVAGLIGGFILLALILLQVQAEQSIGPRGVAALIGLFVMGATALISFIKGEPLDSGWHFDDED